MMENEMPKDLKKLMKKNNFELMKQNGHLHWKHKKSGLKLVTSTTPSNQKAIMHIRMDIRKLLGAVA